MTKSASILPCNAAARFCGASACFFGFALAAYGQGDCGSITDPSGGVTPNLSVNVNNVDTGLVFHCGAVVNVNVLNPAAWTDAPAGTFGTSGRFYNSYRPQRQPAESVSLGRNFGIGSDVKNTLQIRAEFNNTFSNAIVAGGYGSVGAAAAAGTQPRKGQQDARFSF